MDYLENNVITLYAVNDMGHFLLKNENNQMITDPNLIKLVFNDLITTVSNLGFRTYKTKFSAPQKLYKHNNQTFLVDFSQHFF